ncbi:MAG: SufB/SufD family protein [Gaiellaceae bacterium]
MSRQDLLERYRALPLPTTSDEAWRFTDLKGFDPDAFVQNGHVRGQTPVVSAKAMLAIDVSGLATVSESGIQIERAPDGITFEPLREHARLGELVGTDEKFAAHNAAMWQHGLLVHVPRGVTLEHPLYVRLANSVEGGSLFWRLLVVAEAGSSFSVIEEYSSSSPDLAGYSNAAVELFVEQSAKLEYVSIQNFSAETWHFASHHAQVGRDAELDWVAGGFGSKKGKSRIQNDLAGPGATSRVTGAYFADGTQHLDYDTFQEHIAPHTTSDFAFKGALRDNARTVWRGMIRVE